MSTVRLRRLRGFALIELLVVIGIIAVLISILLPALAKARQQALRVKCASNLKQVAAAINMYIGENKGYLPIGKIYPCGEWTDGYFWFDHIDPYLHRPLPPRQTSGERPVIWECPVDDPKAVAPPNGAFDLGHTGYGYNTSPMLPRPPIPESQSLMVIEVNPPTTGAYLKIVRIPDKNQRGMVSDSRSWFASAATGGWDPSMPVTPFQLQNLSPDRHAAFGQSASTNVLFFDSHVEPLSALDAVIAFGNPARVGWSTGP